MLSKFSQIFNSKIPTTNRTNPRGSRARSNQTGAFVTFDVSRFDAHLWIHKVL